MYWEKLKKKQMRRYKKNKIKSQSHTQAQLGDDYQLGTHPFRLHSSSCLILVKPRSELTYDFMPFFTLHHKHFPTCPIKNFPWVQLIAAVWNCIVWCVLKPLNQDFIARHFRWLKWKSWTSLVFLIFFFFVYSHVQLGCTKIVSSKYSILEKKKVKEKIESHHCIWRHQWPIQVAELFQGRPVNRKAWASSIKMQRKSNLSVCS